MSSAIIKPRRASVPSFRRCLGCRSRGELKTFTPNHERHYFCSDRCYSDWLTTRMLWRDVTISQERRSAVELAWKESGLR